MAPTCKNMWTVYFCDVKNKNIFQFLLIIKNIKVLQGIKLFWKYYILSNVIQIKFELFNLKFSDIIFLMWYSVIRDHLIKQNH